MTFRPSKVRPSPRGRSAGFTLVELLVVMGIIIVIAAVSVPAFRFITGSRSVDSGQNVINAMIGRARSAALTTGQSNGVFVFLDPRNDRTTLALVHQNNADSEYTGWSQIESAGQTVDPTTGASGGTGTVQYFDSTNQDIDPSTALQTVVTSEVVPGTAFSRLAAIPFQCVKTHTSSTGTQMQSVPIYYNSQWNSNAGGLEIVRDSELQLLPQGVGVQVVIDPQMNIYATHGVGWDRVALNRYVRTGCILFDSQGRFTSAPYDVYAASHLGQALMLNQMNFTSTGQLSLAGGLTPPTSQIPLFSGFGVVLYDRQSFLTDAKINGYSEGDYLYGDATLTQKQHLPGPPFGAEIPVQGNQQPSNATSPELIKQAWLDANGSLLTATRYNGALTRSE